MGPSANWSAIWIAAPLLLAGAGASALPCNFNEAAFAAELAAQGGQNWNVPAGRVLCTGTYTVPGTLTLVANRQLFIGDGQKPVLRASTMRLNGVVSADGAGYAGGAGCETGDGRGGANGSGPGAGLGAAAFTPSGAAGGSGGGGGAYGSGGGSGGLGNSSAIPGAGGTAYGTQAVPGDSDPGSGGGGAGCGNQDRIDGGDGGSGGGHVRLEAKDIIINDTASSPAISANALNGTTGLVDGWAGVGAGGGGGAGGVILVYATEQLAIGGRLSANGGNGANAGRTFQNARGGGGGGGAGGRIKLFRPTTCTTPRFTVNAGARGTGWTNQQAGEPGAVGTFHCANIQAAPVVAGVTATPASGNEGGLDVTVAVTASDANGHLLKYEFDCDGNGSYELPAQVAGTATCRYVESGTYTPRVRVTDWNSIAITVPSTPAPPAGVVAGNYAAGTFAFGGATSSSAPAITIANVAPAVTATIPATGAEGATLTFGATISDTPGDAAARFTVAWDWGDGSTSNGAGVASPASATHAYADDGTYTVKVTVTDRDGGKTEKTGTVTIANGAPTATLGALPSPIFANNGNYSFGATATDPSAADRAAGFEYTFTFQRAGGAAVDTKTVSASANNGAGVTVAQPFTLAGSYTVSVTAKDRNGAVSAVASAVFSVTDAGAPSPPAVTITTNPASRTIDETGQLSFSATWVDPNGPDNGFAFTYEWRWGDGSANTGGTTSAPAFTTAPSTQHPFRESGTYTVVLAVTDRTGLVGLAQVTVTVNNVAPVGQITTANVAGREGAQVGVSAAASDVSAGDNAAGFSYTFSWGDGTPDTVVNGTATATATHTYADSGAYDVALTVKDRDNGTSARVTKRATIDNENPTATLTAPAGGAEGAPLAFSAVAADVSPADVAAGFTFEWDFGDGSPKENGLGASAKTHAFRDNGTYTVTLKVVDKDGGQVVKTATVAVTNAPPAVEIDGGDRTAARGETLPFAATVTDPGAADTFTYAWAFGDGGSSTDATPQHGWSALGSYTVTLTVTDKDGATATDTIVVQVRNRAPVVTDVALAPATPKNSDDLTLTYAYADADGDAEAGTAITWFVDGLAVAAHADRKVIPGSATARGQVWFAEVTPKDGTNVGAAVRSNEVTIGNEPPVASTVLISPATPRAGDTLAVRWSFTDDDGDAEDGTTIRWTKNGAAQPSLDDRRNVPAPLKKGDSWAAAVTPKDGASFGAEVQSPAVTVGNTAPSIMRLEDVATPATGQKTQVSWTIEASDVDGDALTYACTHDGELLGETSTPSARFAVGTYVVSCTVSDGTDSTTDELTIAVGDVPPVVDAGPDVTLDPGRPKLVAVGRDTLDRALTYAWRVVSSAEPIALTSTATAETEFFARKAGAYELEVTVSNGVKQASDRVVVTIRNVAPSAVITPSLVPNAREFDPVTLAGIGSSDANGDVLTYLWERVSGPGIVFEGSPADSTARFVPQLAGELVVRLTVTDGSLSHSATATVRVAPRNTGGTPPIAKAGPDGEAIVGETVLLDGSGSYDPDGPQGLEYQWNVLSGPAITITDSDRARASFVATAAGTFLIGLTVSDGTFSAQDELSVTVVDAGGNERPIAVLAETELEAQLNATVLLDGSQSSDPEGAALAWKWRWVDDGTGPRVTLLDADAPTASFVATSAGLVKIELVVNDGTLDSLPVQALVRVTEGVDLAPIAVAKGPGRATVSLEVKLDGTASSDPEGRPLFFSWTQVGGPNAQLIGADTAQPHFTPIEAGTYAFELVVNDGLFPSEPARVEVEAVVNQPPVAIAKVAGDAGLRWVEETVAFDGSASADPEGSPLTYRWVLKSGPPATLAAADSATPNFVPSKNGTYVFELVVKDDMSESAPATVTVEVQDLPFVEGGCGCDAGGSLGAFALLGLAALARRRGRK